MKFSTKEFSSHVEFLSEFTKYQEDTLSSLCCISSSYLINEHDPLSNSSIRKSLTIASMKSNLDPEPKTKVVQINIPFTLSVNVTSMLNFIVSQVHCSK